MVEPQPKMSIIVPVFNSRAHLKTCLNSIVQAIHEYGNAELILVDNGSTDGSFEILRSDYAEFAKIYQLRDVTISALRNYGARVAAGDFLCFIDSDFLVPQNYLQRVIQLFESVDTDAAGWVWSLPESSHWVEETWQTLHSEDRDRYVPYLPSGNFVIRNKTYDELGGFREDLITGEDAELGVRMTASGVRMYESRALAAVNLGNPKSLRAFFWTNLWHGLGMMGGLSYSWFDKTLLMTLLHLAFTVVGLLNLFYSGTRLRISIAELVLLMSIAPASAVIYRSARRRAMYRPLRSFLLYHVYFAARVSALFKLVYLRFRGRDRPQNISPRR